ncbi:MAG: CARDB domain-containing protein [Chitinophagaceae bacterium]
MKKIIVLITCFVACITGFAQGTLKPVKPLNGQPGKTELPTPNIPPIRPDLEITNINLFSSQRNTATGEYLLTVSVNVKNNSAATAPPSKLHLDFRRESTHGYYFAGARNDVSIGAIPGNTTLSGSYVFHIPLADLGAGTYSLPIQVVADWGNVIAESNENNNTSVQRNITISL